jgi:hypothetical protein
MRILTIVWALLIATASVAGADTPDLAYSLVGAWSCQTYAGNVVNQTFVRNADGSLSGHDQFYLPANPYTRTSFDETYRFDAKSATWTLSSTATNLFGRFTGTAPPWTGETWTFEGSEPLTCIRLSPHPAR